MRSTSWAMLALLAAVAASLPVNLSVARAGKRTFRPDTFDMKEVRPGMKGYGLTVFEGTQPERFGVEVIDVLRNFRPHQDAILIKTLHPRLDVANVVRGMSGSPIYLEGKMVGAYAYGWSFGKEPVAGVTPIGDMLSDLERPLPPSIHGFPLRLLPRRKAPSAEAQASLQADPHRYAGAPEDYSLYAHADQLGRHRARRGFQPGGLRPVSTPVQLGGWGDAAFEVARELLSPLGLEPVQGGGGAGAASAEATNEYVDGGAIAVQLIRGDLNATGLGTVTRVEGDRLVAFGHPMMNAGVTALPTAVARVMWVLASESASFKLGAPVRPLGALVNDRQASIVVAKSAQAPVMPVRFEIDGVPGAPHEHWSFEVAHEKFMTPSLLAMALGNALQATGADRQDVSWSALSEVKIRGFAPIELEDFGVAVGGTPDPREFAQTHLVSSIGGVLNNPWEPALIESIRTRLRMRYTREISQLQAARAVNAEVEAGGTARLILTLLPFDRKPVEKTIEIPIPRHLAGKQVKLSIQPGHGVKREQAKPESLAEFVHNLENPIFPPKSIVVSYEQGSGIAFRGRVAESLPPGALDRLRTRAESVQARTFRSQKRHLVPLEDFMVGDTSVTIRVKPAMR